MPYYWDDPNGYEAPQTLFHAHKRIAHTRKPHLCSCGFTIPVGCPAIRNTVMNSDDTRPTQWYECQHGNLCPRLGVNDVA